MNEALDKTRIQANEPRYADEGFTGETVPFGLEAMTREIVSSLHLEGFDAVDQAVVKAKITDVRGNDIVLIIVKTIEGKPLSYQLLDFSDPNRADNISVLDSDGNVQYSQTLFTLGYGEIIKTKMQTLYRER